MGEGTITHWFCAQAWSWACVDKDPHPTLVSCEDGYQGQKTSGWLVKIEVNRGKRLKEGQRPTDIQVRYDIDLSQKRVAWSVLLKLGRGKARLSNRGASLVL
jgi:hypothetical protein